MLSYGVSSVIYFILNLGLDAMILHQVVRQMGSAHIILNLYNESSNLKVLRKIYDAAF